MSKNPINRELLEASTVWPRKSWVQKDIESCLLKVSYKCDTNKCKFDDAVEKTIRSVDLKSQMSNELAADVIIAIDKNQDNMTASNVDGYIIQNGAQPIIYLENLSERNPIYDAKIKRFERTPIINLTTIAKRPDPSLIKINLFAAFNFTAGLLSGIILTSWFKKRSL